MPQKYQRLSHLEREEISVSLGRHERPAVIARRLHRSRSTITREIHNQTSKYERYWAVWAHGRAKQMASSRKLGRRKLLTNEPLREAVHRMLRERWSPTQIAKRLVMEYPHDTAMRISDEAIYQYIYVLPRGELKKTLIQGLRQEHAWRRKRKTKEQKLVKRKPRIAQMFSIEERPAEVADRIVPGHWEGDLVMGKSNHTALGTLVERVTRYTLLVQMGRTDARSVRLAFTRAVRKLPKHLKKTLTYDQGQEMSQHKKFTMATGTKVFFAHPRSPWERGTNENTNGLVRQYFPKGTDFSWVSPAEITEAQHSLNNRPRAVLNFHTPNEAFSQLVALEA